MAVVSLTALCAHAADYAEHFDEHAPTWTVQSSGEGMEVRIQRNDLRNRVMGSASERWEILSTRPSSQVVLRHSLPPAVLIEDLSLTLWLNSNREGFQLSFQVVLPHHRHPRTGEPITFLVPGGQSQKVGEWEQLSCKANPRKLREQLVWLRALFDQPEIDGRDAFVSAAVLTGTVDPGVVSILTDEMRFGPIVQPNQEILSQTGNLEQKVQQLVHFQLDRLLVEDRPFFLRMITFQGEQVERLRTAGINVVWIPDYEDDALLERLQKAGLWATATPPRSIDSDGELLPAHQAALAPFDAQRTSRVLFWNLGVRIPGSRKDELASWSDQVQSADRQLQRPVMADVLGEERSLSRSVPLLGLSRHIVNTNFSYSEYRDWLLQKSKLSGPGSFLWTWIQTEPVTANSAWRYATDKTPILIEPEQIRLQVYAALSAGYRGLGFWTTHAVDGNRTGDGERMLTLTQLNLELDLLEPWLAMGTLIGRVPVSVPARTEKQSGKDQSVQHASHEEEPLLKAAPFLSLTSRSRQNVQPDMQAAIIRSDLGTLLLPVWYEAQSQFVPGQLTARDVTIVVPGVDESALAWEISTTGIESVRRRRVAGGIEIVLPKLDMNTAVLLTSDMEVIEQLRHKVRQTAERSARVQIDLATEKFKRVRKVDAQLQALGAGHPQVTGLFERANDYLGRAERLFAQQNYHAARLSGADTMQMLRVVQRMHWERAIERLSSPVSSPYTICFQTLPDYWRMLAVIGRTKRIEQNLLKSGDFEDLQTVLSEGWQHEQHSIEGVHSLAELYATAHKGRYSLRLAAFPETGQDIPAAIGDFPVRAVSPVLQVSEGEIVHVSGWIQVMQPIVSSIDGVLLYDNFTGPAGALQWKRASGWQRFELIREIPRSGEFSFAISLNGLGDVLLDDVRVVRYRPTDEAVASQPDLGKEDTAKQPGSPFDFLHRLPPLRLVPSLDRTSEE